MNPQNSNQDIVPLNPQYNHETFDLNSPPPDIQQRLDQLDQLGRFLGDKFATHLSAMRQIADAQDRQKIVVCLMMIVFKLLNNLLYLVLKQEFLSTLFLKKLRL